MSDTLNAKLGQGRARDRHRRLGVLRRRTRTRATPTSRSSSRAPSRSCGAGRGDNRFRDRLYDFSRRAMRYVVDNLDADKDGWPEGLGQRRARGHGRGEARQHRLPDPRALRPRRHGRVQARPGDRALGARARRRSCAARSTRRGGTPRRTQYADSLGRQQRAGPAAALDRRHADGGEPALGAAPAHAERLRSTCARRTASAARAVQPRPLPHGLRRAARRARARRSSSRSTPRSRPSPTATTAAAKSQRRYTDANAVGVTRRAARRAARDPAVARPERATSTAAGRAARCSCRPGATTAPRGR